MDTTTASALRAQFVTAIRDISPTFSRFQNEKWRYVRSPDEVPGPKLRLFTLLSDIPVPEDPDVAVQGGGVSYVYNLQVMANYADLPLVDDEQIIGEDFRDIWLALDASKTNNSGLMDVSPLDPPWATAGETEDGHVWGTFNFEVTFFGRNA